MDKSSMTRREFILYLARGGAVALLCWGSTRLAGKVRPVLRGEDSENGLEYKEVITCDSLYRCRSCKVVSRCLLPQGLSYKKLVKG